MGETTNIGWTDHTFNIVWGCQKVSLGCQFCYAERDSTRYGFDLWGPNSERRTFGDKHWNEPLKWDKAAELAGKPSKVFCSSMCDIYEDHPTVTSERNKLWDVVDRTPHLIWLLLTKRPERIKANTPNQFFGRRNIWFGTSAETQTYWDTRVFWLEDLPDGTAIDSHTPTFVSVEPLLGRVVMGDHFTMDWVIIGGESGHNFRPCNPDWVSDLALEANAANIMVYVKQDAGRFPGKQGSIPSEIWAMKEVPR